MTPRRDDAGRPLSTAGGGAAPGAGSDPTALLEMIHAGWMSQALHVAARLGVAEALAAGPRTTGELAAEIGAHPDSLRRLLRALAALGLCAERDDRAFELTPLGGHLRADAPRSVRSVALHWGGAMWPIWGGLLHSVRTGRSPRALVARRDAFESLAQRPEAMREFNAAMVEVSRLAADGIVRACDLSGVGHLVDVGGGHGELLAAILTAWPHLRGTLADLPHVLAGAGPHLEAAGVAARCALVPGSFFDAVPAGGDAYLLKSVLHDWDDERAGVVLANCRRAMAGQGMLLVVERVLPDRMEASDAHRFMAASDLGMMVAAAGRERTAGELRALLGSAGFALARIRPAALHYSVVEATCA